MRLRPVASGWIRAALFAALSVVALLLLRHVMARSSGAPQTFALTCIAIAAIPMIDEVRWRARRPDGRLVQWEPLPVDVTFERLGSPRSLAWPLALLIWVLVPVGIAATGVNYLVGLAVHDVPASMGAVSAALAGALAGVTAWMALRTVAVWRTASGLQRWPAWTDAGVASLRFRPFVAEWRRQPVYYYRKPPRPRP